MHSEKPLVSCGMITRGRPQFAAEAVRNFHAQTWENKELVILDDADAPSFPAPPDGARYFRSATRLAIGGKRNSANARARGEYICTWDDDDYSAPGRIADQLARLLLTGKAVTGYGDLDFVAPDSEVWVYPLSQSYAPGSTLFYSRDFWIDNPFPAAENINEEKLFQQRAYLAWTLEIAPANGMMHATIHPGNTSPRDLTQKPWVRKVA